MTGAIIAEFNPFHNGHKALIDFAREYGCDGIIAVMSGCFVQRGEPAIAAPSVRAGAALMSGIDLILENPVTGAMAGARKFAESAVSVIEATGIADKLFFGSECGDIELLKKTAAITESKEFSDILRGELMSGKAFAAAREEAVKKICPEAAEILSNPNDILGIEYIRALKNSEIEPVCFKRTGVGHDEDADGVTASAGALREMLLNGRDISDYVPDGCSISNADIAKKENAERAVLARLRSASPEEIASAPDVSEGIENRIYEAARSALTLNDVYDTAKAKRYSHARIRRIVMSFYLGITAEDSRIPPQYIAVNGFTDNGREMLKEMRRKASLPVVMKNSDISSLSEKAKRIYELECRANDMYALCFDLPAPCGARQRATPLYFKK